MPKNSLMVEHDTSAERAAAIIDTGDQHAGVMRISVESVGHSPDERDSSVQIKKRTASALFHEPWNRSLLAVFLVVGSNA
jgi:hypothetical protein